MLNNIDRKNQIDNIIKKIKNILDSIDSKINIDTEKSNILEEDETNNSEKYNINDDIIFIINEILKMNPSFFETMVKTIKDVIINKNLDLLNVIEKYDIFEQLFTEFDSLDESNKNLFNLDNFSDLLKFIVNIIIVNNHANVNSETIIENLSNIIDSSVNIIRIFNLF